MVIYLSIENESKILGFVRERLVTARHINDREAAHTKSDRAVNKKPIIIWTSLDHAIRHCLKGQERYLAPVEPDYSGDTTHLVMFRDERVTEDDG